MVGNTDNAIFLLYKGQYVHSLKEYIVILTGFLSLAAPEVVKMTTSGVANDENCVKMKSILQCSHEISTWFYCNVFSLWVVFSIEKTNSACYVIGSNIFLVYCLKCLAVMSRFEAIFSFFPAIKHPATF